MIFFASSSLQGGSKDILQHTALFKLCLDLAFHNLVNEMLHNPEIKSAYNSPKEIDVFTDSFITK